MNPNFKHILAGLLLWSVLTGASAYAAALVKLVTEDAGIHRISYQQLVDSGVDLQGVRHKRLAISFGGEPVAVYSKGQVSRDKNQRRFFGPGGYLEFYATARDSLYTAENAYTLHISKAMRRNFQKRQTPKLNRRLGYQTSYAARLLVEENMYYDFLAPSKTDPWHFGQLIASGGTLGTPRSFILEGVVDGPQRIDVEVYGIVDLAGPGNDHDVAIAVNNTVAGGQQFDGNQATTISLTNAAGAFNLVEGGNTIRMDLNGIEGMPFDAVALNKAVVTYTRHAAAYADLLHGQMSAGQYRIAGFTGKGIRVYVKGQNDDWHVLTKARRRGSASNGYRIEFVLEQAAEVMILGPKARLTPRVEMLEDESDITSGKAEYLIVAHADFIGPELSGFAQYRAQTSGLTVKVVDVAQIYQQFGQAVPDAQPIHRYVKFAAKSLDTKYLLLVGGDQYDYKNHISNAVSFVPTLYAVTPGGKLKIQQNPVDSLYGDLDGDQVPDIPVGRFPVRTLAELTAVTEKVLDYEASQGYQNLALVAADINDNGNNISFEAEAESIIDMLPADWQSSAVRVYPESAGAAVAKNRLIDGFAAGSRLVSYVGHSAEQVWSRSTPPLMSAAEITGLANQDRPAVVTQWGCWNTYFVKPESNSMAQAFLLTGNAGAATVLGASSLTSLSAERALSEKLMPRLMSPGTRIGDAVIAAKQELRQTMPTATDVILGWQILGDPALIVNP